MIVAEVPWLDTMLIRPCAPQPPGSNIIIRIRVVGGAGDISPEGGVTAQSGIVDGEDLDTVITWIG